MFETTKPATTGANRSISAGNDHFKCSYIDRSFLFVRKIVHWSSIHMLNNLSISLISFSLVVIDFVVLELIPAIDVSFLCISCHDLQCGLFPYSCCSGNTTYSLDSFKIFDYLKLLFNSFPFACTICLFWIKMLKHSWDVQWVCFYVEKFLSAKE